VGIPTSQNPDTLEGLKSRFSVRIYRILTELSHSTELELRKLIEPEQIPTELMHLSYSKDS
jgi:hypothetical protein